MSNSSNQQSSESQASRIRNMILAIMERESKKYYVNMYDIFADKKCINEILIVARRNGDIKERIYVDTFRSPSMQRFHLREAIRDQIFETDKLFTDKEKLERYYNWNDLTKDRIPFSETTLEDVICFLEDVVYYTRLILIAMG